LLIADVVMPHMTGIELAIQVKSKYPKCKVLLLSGRTISADLLEEANKAGHHFALLAKPVHATELLATLKGLCGGSLSPAISCWVFAGSYRRLESSALRIDVNLMGFDNGFEAGRCLLFEYRIALASDYALDIPALDRIDFL
jgi:DNA-binding NarL/FixJ family response regulator